ncbi:FtsB family cell division protein [Enterovibrio coralii]|uniref:DUF4189 domain-containing protein n=1 Tax=Enterovibrio coralii TaxID=294935 RepID=A0A135IB88_9GAMM|nr:hypothetical protein [Enterovibrio coralii]KXF82624.1 hypothetical protein ATN88_21420 [Enterovibrio coralii]
MKTIKIIIAVVAVFAASSSYAFEEENFLGNNSVRQEIRELQRQVKQLERRVRQLEREQGDSSISSRWGCYLDDLRAGGIYGTGYTKAEAKGRVLEKCAEKDGTCFESSVKCSTED